MHPSIPALVRRCTNRLVFTKRLPRDFARLPLYVTPRADLRMLYPGFHRSSSDLMLVAQRFVKPGACVWDIGSNQGIFAACAAAMAGPTGRVFTLEPDPTYAALQFRSYARFPDTVAPCTVLAAAVLDRISVLDLALSAKGHTTSRLAPFINAPTSGRKPVVTVTLDFLLDYWPAPDFVKIDVEGADVAALTGGLRLLKEVRPILYLESDREAQDLLDGLGYDRFRLRGDGSLDRLQDHHYDVVAVPRERASVSA